MAIIEGAESLAHLASEEQTVVLTKKTSHVQAHGLKTARKLSSLPMSVVPWNFSDPGRISFGGEAADWPIAALPSPEFGATKGGGGSRGWFRGTL